MPVSSNNNTTPLGAKQTSFSPEGQPSLATQLTARQFNSEASRIVSRAVAVQSYRNLKMTDEKISMLRQALINDVSNWSTNSKMDILIAYSVAIPVNMKELDINELVVETLITNLPEGDLENILKQIKTAKVELKQKFDTAQKMAKKNRRKELSSLTIDDFSKRLQHLKGKKLTKNIKKTTSKDHRVSRILRSGYVKLQKELRDIIDFSYNDAQLATLAIEMGITFDEPQVKRKKLITAIIARVVLYVDIVVGKNKRGIWISSFDNIEPFNDLLQYTSYAFVTGKPGLSFKDLRTIQTSYKEMLRANIKVRKAKIKGNILQDNEKWRAKQLTKLRSNDIGKEFESNLNSIEDLDKVLEIANRYNIKVKKSWFGFGNKFDPAKVKQDILVRVSSIITEQSKLEAKIAKRAKQGKTSVNQENRLKALRGTTTLFEKKKEETVAEVKAWHIRNGEADITLAMPVVVLDGQGRIVENFVGPKVEKYLFKGIPTYKQIDQMLEKAVGIKSYIKALYCDSNKGFSALTKWQSFKYTSNGASVSDSLAPQANMSTGHQVIINNLNSLHAEASIAKDARLGILERMDKILEFLKSSGLGGSGQKDYSVTDQMMSDAVKYAQSGRGGKPNSLEKKTDARNLYRLAKIYAQITGEQMHYRKHKVTLKDKDGNPFEKTDNIPQFAGADGKLEDAKKYKMIEEIRKRFEEERKAGGTVTGGKGGPGGTILTNRISQSQITEGVTNGVTTALETLLPKISNQFKNPKFDAAGFEDRFKKQFADDKAYWEEFKEKDDLKSRLKTLKENMDEAKGSKEKKKASKVYTDMVISSMIDNNSKALGFTKIKEKEITPVYVTNKAIGTDMLEWTKKLISVLISALKASVILAPVGFGLEIGMKAAGLLDMFATGTHGKFVPQRKPVGKQRKTTQFIAGDSLNGKPNEEKIQIDWDKKEYSVKPIPKLAKGGTSVSPTSGKTAPLSNAERSSPMAVQFTSHLMTYGRKVDGDDGSGQALKVYMVNPSITDEVEVAGGRASLIGLVSDISNKLDILNATMGVGNEIASSGVAASAAIVTAISKLGSSKGGGNFFAGFPTELDDILAGK